MLGRVVEELRKIGVRKLAILAVLIVVAVVLAYGNNSTDDAASGRTLPTAVLNHQARTIPAPAGRQR